jgi:hypothetical protein
MTFDGTCFANVGGVQRAPQETEKIPPVYSSPMPTGCRLALSFDGHRHQIIWPILTPNNMHTLYMHINYIAYTDAE